jgi:hypothetical protein
MIGTLSPIVPENNNFSDSLTNRVLDENSVLPITCIHMKFGSEMQAIFPLLWMLRSDAIVCG